MQFFQSILAPTVPAKPCQSTYINMLVHILVLQHTFVPQHFSTKEVTVGLHSALAVFIPCLRHSTARSLASRCLNVRAVNSIRQFEFDHSSRPAGSVLA